MGRTNLKGCATALITPFKNGEVDYAAYANLVDRQVEAGMDFLVPLGTTAETPCLTDEEKVELLKIAREHAPETPLVVGVGTNSLVHTIENIKLLEPYGPDAYLVVVPYYNKPTQEGLYQYFKAVAASTQKPIVLYNVPGRTGVNLSVDTTLALAEIENIVAVKEASGNYSQIASILRSRPEGFAVFSGNDDETLSLMATGAEGVISVASNVAPAQMVELTHYMLEGKIQQAREVHNALWPLFKNCFIESNPIPVKSGLWSMGLIENELRLPLVPASEKTQTIMAETVKNLGF